MRSSWNADRADFLLNMVRFLMLLENIQTAKVKNADELLSVKKLSQNKKTSKVYRYFVKMWLIKCQIKLDKDEN